MTPRTVASVAFLVIAILFFRHPAQAQQSLLTPEEAAHLKAMGEVRMCVDPDWMPYERIDDKGRHIGIAADFMAAFQSILGTPITLQPTKTWTESLDKAKARDCDILSLLSHSPERAEYLNFTAPYVTAEVVLVAKNDVLYLDGLPSMAGRTLAVSKGYVYEDYIRRNYPDIFILPVDNISEGLVAVSEGRAVAAIDTLFIVLHHIQELGLSNLKIAGHTEFKAEFRVGVRKDDPLLLSAFEKVVNSVLPEDRNQIFQRWQSVRIEHGFDYTWVWRVGIAAGLVILFTVYRASTLHAFNRKLEAVNQQLTDKNVELERASQTDHLTGIFNRVKTDQELENEVARAKRYGRPFSVILFDIDHFKRVNDDFGHQAGDAVLIEVTKVALAALRRNDKMGRWGGEEFIVICPETPQDGALHLAEKLRAAIAGLTFGNGLNVSASFGVAEYQDGDDETSIVRNADGCLYDAKRGGRNQVRA